LFTGINARNKVVLGHYACDFDNISLIVSEKKKPVTFAGMSASTISEGHS